MGGLQNGVIERSKMVGGRYVIEFKEASQKELGSLLTEVQKVYPNSYLELKAELLLRKSGVISPIIMHGLDLSGVVPPFMKFMPESGGIIGRDLAYSTGLNLSENVELISASHVDSFFGDIPRSVTMNVQDFISVEVPEIDGLHGWVRISLLQSLFRKRSANLIRIFDFAEPHVLENLTKDYQGAVIKSWEARNQTLVWALTLENSMMTFLFVSMTVLVGICITSGLLIYFNKIRYDLSSFWILGGSKESLIKSCGVFIVALNASSVLLGLASGLIFLWLFALFGPEVLPDVFVDQTIPIKVTLMGVFTSFFIPLSLSLLFSFFSLNQFKKETNFLEMVRSVG
jgi:lipoprotein-releasing system permease protein